MMLAAQTHHFTPNPPTTPALASGSASRDGRPSQLARGKATMLGIMIMIVIAVHVRLVMMLRVMVLLMCVVMRPLAVLMSKITNVAG